MQKFISQRQAAKLEHPEGIPLSKTHQEHGFALGGMLRISFDPPVATKNAISIGVFGGINGTNDQFSGILETGYAGDAFVPSQSLISSVKKMVNDMAAEMHNNNEESKIIVMEEILSAITIHVPVRQVYDKIRSEYPVEYRAMNIDYKRRNGISIEEDMFVLVSKQHRQLYQFSSLMKALNIRLALYQPNELVQLNDRKLQRLKHDEPQAYDDLMKRLEGVEPINGVYVVLGGEQNRQVTLIGKNNKNEHVKTKTMIPTQYLEPVSEEEEEDDLTPEERRDYGFEAKQETGKAATQQEAPKPMSEYEKANALFVETINSWARNYAKSGEHSGKNFQTPKGVIKKVKLESSNIPAAVYTDKKTALQYGDLIVSLYHNYFTRKYQIADPQFLALYEYLKIT